MESRKLFLEKSPTYADLGVWDGTMWNPHNIEWNFHNPAKGYDEWVLSLNYLPIIELSKIFSEGRKRKTTAMTFCYTKLASPYLQFSKNASVMAAI